MNHSDKNTLQRKSTAVTGQEYRIYRDTRTVERTKAAVKVGRTYGERRSETT